MSEVIHNASEEFWQPPVVEPGLGGTTLLAEACRRCETEFMVGARFCHICGADRQEAASETSGSWSKTLELLRVLEFHRVQERLGLSMASLVAFFSGVGCILAALAVGIIYSAQNLADFQAIQLWRMQWLLGALVAFVAGILLKRPGVGQ
jgi:MFS family permease